MCTVVLRHEPGAPVRILALRDEFVGRAFDDPDAWWPDRPTVVGGRDRVAGGSWCVSDIASGVTALVVNRIERFDGAPSRGLLPLAAAGAGPGWTDDVDHTGMASFNLVLAGPGGVSVWAWDAVELRRRDLEPGTHLITSSGVDAADPKTVRFAPLFDRDEPAAWRDVVIACTPSGDESALVVRRQHEDRTFATVFGQQITAVPGALHIDWSREPWSGQAWRTRRWPA